MNSDCLYIEDSETLRGSNKFSSMGDVKRATEKFRSNPLDPNARDVINAYRKFRLNCIQTCLSLIGKSCPPANGLISARLKRMKSIQRKIARGQKGAVNQMDDIIGFRVICQSYNDAMAMSSRIRNSLNAKMKNYLTNEHFAGTGYRAQHGIVRFNQPMKNYDVKVRFEIQIRSWYQHLWACWSESHGEHAKEGFRHRKRIDNQTQQLIENFRQHSHEIAEWEESYPNTVQNGLPELCELYHVSIAWFNPQMKYFFSTFRNDISTAAQNLIYLESKADIEPILLIGVTDADNLRNFLLRTHPHFMRRGFWKPKYWMPRDIPVIT